MDSSQIELFNRVWSSSMISELWHQMQPSRKLINTACRLRASRAPSAILPLCTLSSCQPSPLHLLLQPFFWSFLLPFPLLLSPLVLLFALLLFPLFDFCISVSWVGSMGCSACVFHGLEVCAGCEGMANSYTLACWMLLMWKLR